MTGSNLWGKAVLLTAVVLGPVALAAASVVTYVQLDKTHVFYEVKGEYRETRILSETRTDTSTVRHVAYINHRQDTVATAYVRLPHDLAEDYHVMQTYAGRRTGAEILDLIPDQNDLVLVALQYPYETPETDAPDFVDALRLLFAPYEVRQAAFRAIAAGMLSVTHLQKKHDIPPERVTVVGASLGVFFAPVHVALDERVPRLLVVHGGGHLPTIWRHILNQREEWWIPVEFVAWFNEIFVGTFDPIHWVGKISPRETYIIGSTSDRYFPEESIRRLYEQAREPKTIRWTEGAHVGTDNRELVRTIVGLVQEYFDELELDDASSR